MFLLSLLSCANLSTNCRSLFGQSREDCFADRILTEYEQSQETILQLAHTELSTTTHDFILMELTRKYHPQSRHLCEKMKDTTLQKRCILMISRPHLQRKKMIDKEEASK